MWTQNDPPFSRPPVIRLSIYLSVTKAIAGLQIRALLQLYGAFLIIDLTLCILKLLGGELPVFGLLNHCHRNRHEILHKNVDQPSSNFFPSPKLKNFLFGGQQGGILGGLVGVLGRSNFCSSTKLKNSIFGVIKVN